MQGRIARALLEGPDPGTHAIFWRDDSVECDSAIAAFLHGAVRRNDFTLLVLPQAELRDLSQRLYRLGTDLEDLVDQGYLVRATFEDIARPWTADPRAIRRDFEALREFARSVGRTGLSILGRIGPVYFESDQQETAETIEGACQENRGDLRILCLYQARSLRPERFSQALKLTRQHTQAITAIGGDRFFLETVRPTPKLELVPARASGRLASGRDEPPRASDRRSESGRETEEIRL